MSGDIEWILESSATDNACNDRTAFTKFTHKVQNIAVADGKYCRCKCIGEVAGISNDNYIPSFVCNLLSIPHLCMDGWKVTFIHRTCILERDDIRIQATNTQKMDCLDSQQIVKDKKTRHNKLTARMTLSSLIIEHSIAMQAHQQVKNDIAINKKDIRLKFPTPISHINVGGMRTSKD